MSEETLKTEEKQPETVKVETVKNKKEKSKKVSAPKTEKPKPNIAFAASSESEPIVGKFNIGTLPVELPSAKEQQKPFYHPDAGLIICSFRHLYKPVKAKG